MSNTNDVYMPPVPTLGRIVHYRLDDRWVAALVVDDTNATEYKATELEAHPPAPYGVFYAGNVPRGDAPGCWRWPPRT